VTRIIREILALLWKVIRQVLWKWLKPLLARFFFLVVFGLAIITLLVMVVVRGC
jgi:hypothetical protein